MTKNLFSSAFNQLSMFLNYLMSNSSARSVHLYSDNNFLYDPLRWISDGVHIRLDLASFTGRGINTREFDPTLRRFYGQLRDDVQVTSVEIFRYLLDEWLISIALAHFVPLSAMIWLLKAMRFLGIDRGMVPVAFFTMIF